MTSDQALVSVIMPVRNEAAYIMRSLAAVLDQDYPSERIEIVVVDGESDDDTVALLRLLPGAERVRVISNPARIQSAGMNLGIRQARGEIIVRVDGHTIIARDYVRCCVEALRTTGAQNAGGCMDPIGLTPAGQAIAAAGKSAFAGPAAFHTSETPGYTDTVYLGAWPRTTLVALGGFDERMRANEDYELNYRIRAMGGRVFLSPAIRSKYIARQSLSGLARQYFQYGRGKTFTLRKHWRSVRPRHLAAPIFILFLMGVCPAVFLGPWSSALWGLGAATYVVLSLLIAAHAARAATTGRMVGTPRVGLLWRVSLVFLIIHVCWGLGFWLGLLSDWHTPHRAASGTGDGATAVVGTTRLT